MSFNIRIDSLSDLQKLCAAQMLLAAAQPVAAVGSGIDALWDVVNGVVVYPRAGFIPAWFTADGNDQVLVVIDGVRTLQQGLAMYASTQQSMLKVGSWWANATVVTAAQAMFNALRHSFGDTFRRWVLSGYSYGGALAEVLAAMLTSTPSSSSAQIVTWGSPRPGDSTLAALLQRWPLRRLMCDSDPVPRFPPHLGEAPAANVAVGLSGAQQWARYVQPGGGVILPQSGSLVSSPLPRLFFPIADADLALWVTGNDTFRGRGHALTTYAQRIAAADPADPTTAATLALPVGVEPDVSVTVEAFNAVAAEVAAHDDTPLVEGNSVFGYVPPEYRASVTTIGGKYNVEWMGRLVAVGRTKSNAHSIAKYQNAWLRRLQTAASANHTTFSEALVDFLAAASSMPGFSPPLVVD
jgi:hypothetical protein